MCRACRNLLSLKYYDGDIEDLALNFTMAADELGQSKVSTNIHVRSCTHACACTCTCQYMYAHVFVP